MPRVFVSHSSTDRAVIEQTILPLIRAHGIQYWYSPENIPSASDWEKVIRGALAECDWFLVALSASAIQSDWVQAEVHWALDHRRDRFVSLLLSDCTPSDLHLKLIRYQHVDFRQPSDDASRRLVEAFGLAYRNAVSVRLEYRLGTETGNAHALVINEAAMVGRTSESDLVLEERSVASRHALLKVKISDGMKSLWLIDQHSTNGTWLNGVRVGKPMEVVPADRIKFGGVEVVILSISDT